MCPHPAEGGGEASVDDEIFECEEEIFEKFRSKLYENRFKKRDVCISVVNK